mmetsp:Transcript_16070/g.20343  ORF Transcript_16070/g.20343 Transcript_16070/m.20343 type:complete len:199 (-) Transcript_16070:562-1158(-)
MKGMFWSRLIWLVIFNLLAETHLVYAHGYPRESDEAHVQVDLTVSELSNDSGWSITDGEGIKYMGSCAGCTRLFSSRIISVSQCFSRSKCGGDGGDGRLTFSFLGAGYYEYASVYIDGDLVHSGRSNSQNDFSLHCPNESLPQEVPQQRWEYRIDTFFDKVKEYKLPPRQRLQRILKYGIDTLYDKVNEFYCTHQLFT